MRDLPIVTVVVTEIDDVLEDDIERVIVTELVVVFVPIVELERVRLV